MGRMYVANFEDIAITVAQDLFEIAAPADGIIIIHDWLVMQSTDVGDAAEEILEIETVRGDGSVTSGSGGASVTPEPLDNGDPATGATVERNNTTRMAVGTGVLDVLRKYGFNVRMPLEVIYPPKSRPIITPSDRWTLSLNDAPADSITCSGHVTFEEVGG